MEEPTMHFEDVYDVLRHVVQRSGGAKAVGALLYPEKSPDCAGRYLMDCLNPSRAEKLDPEQTLTLLRIGHQNGCHRAMHYLAKESGYSQPEPIVAADEQAELRRRFVAAVVELREMATRIEIGTRPCE